jgi:serine/threonine-protein kinase RsbW
MRPNDQDVAERRRRGLGPAVAAGGLRVAAITMPVSEAYVSLARLATAHVVGALGLSVGRAADLRLAVDEACGQFLHGPGPLFDDDDVVYAAADATTSIELCFDRLPGKLRITVCGPIPLVPAISWPDRESLGWLVLEALVSDVRYEVEPRDGVGTLTIVEPLSADGASRDALWFAAL